MLNALNKTWITYKKAVPILFGMLLLINLVMPYFGSFYNKIFTGNNFFDLILGSLFGSVSAGMPITAYIIGAELMKNSVSLLAVSAFTLTWTTVWVVFLPFEIKCLGRRFAIYRNLTNYVFAVIISILTISILNLISNVR